MRLTDAQDTLLKQCGVTTRFQGMPNGETRFRFVHEAGDECVVTTGSGDPADRNSWSGWQNAHQHGCVFGAVPEMLDGVIQGICEVYVPMTGIMVWAEWERDRFRLSIVQPGQCVISRPGVAHNSLLRPGDSMLTWKVAARRAVPNHDEWRKGADWWPVPDDINAALKAVTLEEIAAETGYPLEKLLAA